MPAKLKPAKLRFGFGGSLGTWPQVETSDDVLVARTYGPDEEDYARMFAAAPDLLEALRVLTAFAATHTGDGATPEEGRLLDGYGEGIAHAVAAGRAAIARAEGRAP